MTDSSTIERVVFSILTSLTPTHITINTNSRLKQDLRLDSFQLLELVVLIYEQIHIDLGQLCSERDFIPSTVGEMIELLEYT